MYRKSEMIGYPLFNVVRTTCMLVFIYLLQRGHCFVVPLNKKEADFLVKKLRLSFSINRTEHKAESPYSAMALIWRRKYNPICGIVTAWENLNLHLFCGKMVNQSQCCIITPYTHTTCLGVDFYNVTS